MRLTLKLGVAALSLLAFVAQGDDETKKKVGVVWEGKASMQTRLMRGFMLAMRDKAPEIVVTVAGELPDIEDAVAQFKTFERTMDAVVFLRSSGSSFLKDYTPRKPCFIGGCNDPVALGAVKSMERPGGMVTGVTYSLPYSLHLDKFASVFPNARSICLLAEQGHPSTSIDVHGTKRECERRGLEFNAARVKNLEELISTVKKRADDVDFFILGQQALIIDNCDNIVEAAADTPVASYAKHCVNGGAVCAIAVNDQKMGVMLAESVIDALVNGNPVGEIPVKTDPCPRLVLNTNALKRHDILVPIDLLKQADFVKTNP